METFLKCLSHWNIHIDDHKLSLFERYYRFLLEWNEKINLTSITDRDEVYIKHFADSISLLNYISISGKTVLDIGTGAGFPGVPLKIICPECKIVLLDSLNKRITFLNELIRELGLSDIVCIHGRAEDIAFDKNHREKYDLVVSRAVANLRTLSEYCLPFVNNNGTFISYKSGNIDEEIALSSDAINLLCGKVDRIEKFSIPGSDIDRSLVFIEKTGKTDRKYPRKAGTPSKNPL